MYKTVMLVYLQTVLMYPNLIKHVSSDQLVFCAYCLSLRAGKIPKRTSCRTGCENACFREKCMNRRRRRKDRNHPHGFCVTTKHIYSGTIFTTGNKNDQKNECRRKPKKKKKKNRPVEINALF